MCHARKPIVHRRSTAPIDRDTWLLLALAISLFVAAKVMGVA